MQLSVLPGQFIAVTRVGSSVVNVTPSDRSLKVMVPASADPLTSHAPTTTATT